jgi:choline dehydrogenase-like flavoprotein
MKINRVDASKVNNAHYELVVIGSGFGSSFFLSEALKHIKGRALIIEWGDYNPWAQQIGSQLNSPIKPADTYKNQTKHPWNTTIGLGGGTNCWYAQTPRLLPADFKTKTLYGVGRDWPISYDELEPFYCRAEQVMAVSGDADIAKVLPRSQPYPQPPHKGSTLDVVMKEKMPDHHFICPTARPRIATGSRAACCANATCSLCPVNAKFTAENGFTALFSDPKVDVCLKTEARSLEYEGNSIKSVKIASEGKEYVVKGDVFVLGANAIQSPAILLRSDIDHGDTGRNLHEQWGCNVEAFLDGIGNFDGSTITTGYNYLFADGDFRKDYASCLISFENRWTLHGMRKEKGRWNQTLPLSVVVEDIPNPDSRVTIDPGSGEAVVNHQDESEYAKAGMKHALDNLHEVLAPLPVEAIHFRVYRATESHVQGTLRMGSENDGSVVDKNLVHHKMRNLVVVGTSTFVSCSSAAPSLTASALSIRAADLLFS